MNVVKIILPFLVAICINGPGMMTYAQPRVPKASIPANMPYGVREEIERLYSSDPIKRGLGAYYLSKMGPTATAAIPFLIAILHDCTALEWKYLPPGYHAEFIVAGGEPTSPGEEAMKTLIKIGEPAVEPLIAALKDKEEVVRERSARALGFMNDIRAVTPLISAMKDKNSRVGLRAAVALGNIGDSRAVPPLIATLKDRDDQIRYNATFVLGKIMDRRAVEPLIAALKDKERFVQGGAAKALGQIKDPRAVEPLIAALKEAIRAVEVAGFKTSAGDVAEKAAEALAKIQDRRAVEPLIAALKSWDPEVRIKAAEALGEIKDLRAVEPLIRALKDDKQHVRSSAIAAMRKMAMGKRDFRIVEALSAVLRNGRSYVNREEAAQALGEIGDLLAVPALIAGLKDEERLVRWSSAKALRKITGKYFGNDSAKWMNWWEQNKETLLKGR